MINYIIFAIGYAFVCVVQPGPFQAFLLSQALTNGWRKTFPLVFAPLFSDVPVIILVIFILKNLPHELLLILQCTGGVFLLYLAFNAYQTWRTFDSNKDQDVPAQKSFFKAVLVNLFNPNPYLGWSLVMGPMLIRGWNEAPANGIVLLAGFYGTLIICSMGMVLLFASARNLGPRAIRISILISAIALVLFGFYQLWSGITGFNI